MLSKLPWRASYISPSDDDVLRYISFEAYKHSPATDLLSVLLHTSAAYGEQFTSPSPSLSAELEESTTRDLLARLHRLLPVLGQVQPVQTYLRFWRQSQVTARIALGRTAACLAIPQQQEEAPAAGTAWSTEPLLLLAGDYFTESNFQGCLRSAQAAARLATQRILAS